MFPEEHCVAVQAEKQREAKKKEQPSSCGQAKEHVGRGRGDCITGQLAASKLEGQGHSSEAPSKATGS
jgi:hypothetical protein